MPSPMEIAERSMAGPKVAEMDWDMGLFQKLTELAQRYEIHVPGQIAWFNADDDLAARVFQAGLDFLVETGVYCQSTQRVVRLSRDEVLTALRDAPDRVVMGSGADRREMAKHPVESGEKLDLCPGLHAPFDIPTGALVAEDLAAMPRTDFLEGFNFVEADGYALHGLPMEVYGTRRQVQVLREAADSVGRPGLALVLYPLNTRIGALLPAIDAKRGLRPGDGLALSVLPDVKIEHDLLAAAMVAHECGLFTLGASFGIVGGFCGGIEGALIEAVVKPIVSLMVYGNTLNVVGVEDSSGGRKKTWQPLAWARSVVAQAFSAHTPLVTMALGFTRSGPGTAGSLRELAIRAIEAQINGGNLYVTRHSKALMNAGQTPLEARWLVEVADAVRRAGLDREQAGRICQALHAQLVGSEAEPGRNIHDIYDLRERRPKLEYEALYLHVRGELSDLGLEMGA